MGEKVNFNKNNSKFNKKKIKIAVILIIAILVVYLLVKSLISVYKSLPQDINNNNNEIVSFKANQYGSLEDLLSSYGCILISKNETSNKLTVYLNFDVNLYTGSTSNENHFLNMCRVIAEFIDFKNFELIDNTRNIDIEVTCEDQKIVEFKVNGDVNYFLNHDSEINSKKTEAKTTEFLVQSKELQQLIDGNWSESKVEWGTKDSTCDGYNIYFEEGIRYKVVSRSVFNVIFTDKYQSQVVSGLTVNSTQDEVESVLGTPTYQNADLLYGYLGKSNYIFFDFLNNEISVYPRVEISESDEQKFQDIIDQMNNSSNEDGAVDVKTFANNLTDLWIDYDVYDFDSNYVDLKYTLRGVELKITTSSLKNGIFVYQNYSGDRDIETSSNVYISSEDLVFENENERIINESSNRIEEGDYTDEELKSMGVDFSIRFNGSSLGDELVGPAFYSRDKSYPDSELSKTLVISSYEWYDDYQIIYSVDDDGIYVYNCRTRVNKKIQDVSGKITINSAGDGKIIYNETIEINVNIQG
jgi:hypothetical protein